jgi:hypothetical protein
VKSGCKRRILGLNHAKVTFYHWIVYPFTTFISNSKSWKLESFINSTKIHSLFFSSFKYFTKSLSSSYRLKTLETDIAYYSLKLMSNTSFNNPQNTFIKTFSIQSFFQMLFTTIFSSLHWNTNTRDTDRSSMVRHMSITTFEHVSAYHQYRKSISNGASLMQGALALAA